MDDYRNLDAVALQIGGRQVQGAWDQLARYCGLEWSGGTNETWAFRYYDATPSARPDVVRPASVHRTGGGEGT